MDIICNIYTGTLFTVLTEVRRIRKYAAQYVEQPDWGRTSTLQIIKRRKWFVYLIYYS